MSTITSVSISNSHSKCFEIPVDVSLESIKLEELVQVEFLGALQETNPTQFLVGITMAQGISAGKPTVNSREPSKVDISITGRRLEGKGTTVFSIINSNMREHLEFEITLNVNGAIVTYKFKKKRGR